MIVPNKFYLFFHDLICNIFTIIIFYWQMICIIETLNKRKIVEPFIRFLKVVVSLNVYI